MTSAIDSDTLSGLPSAGSNIGGFMKGVAPGAGSMILTLGMAKGVSDIFGATAKGVSKRLNKGSKKSKSKKTKQPKSKNKLIPTYKTPKYNIPLIPKMGPY